MVSLAMEVLGSALRAAAEEAQNILVAASPPKNIFSTADCSFAVFTKEGKMAATGGDISLLTSLLPSFVNAVLQTHPFHTISPGDFIITNDPYLYGSQLTDIFAVSPVYFNKRPLALVASAARHSDIGGAVPGGMPNFSGDIFQEGIRIPPVKIIKKSFPNDELLSFFSNNARSGKDLGQSIKAQLWAAQAAEKKLCGLAQKYGFEYLRNSMNDIIESSGQRVLSAFRQIPGSAFMGEGSAGVDPDSGSKLIIKASLINSGDKLTFDFTGTHPQAAAPVNSALGTTLSCVYTAVRSALIPDLPLNDGLFRSIKVNAPPGSLVNPVFPAPVSCSLVGAAQGVLAAVSGIFTGIFPGMSSYGFEEASFFTIGGLKKDNGGYYSFKDSIAGGHSASPSRDGENSWFSSLFTSPAASVEQLESACPIIVNKVGLVLDSGGAGLHRGGLGMELSFTVLDSHATVSACSVTNDSPENENTVLPGAAGISVSRPGRNDKSDTFTGSPGENAFFSIRSYGGRGWGSPLEREPELVRNDVAEGYISPDTARDIYGVVLSGRNLEVNREATAGLRRSLSHERK
ncbi:MAG: hydantoinase B/oxoprolinase family protein [Actinobacteria bacterium]|nr:hydantoinase B/oxoprolinase family protein [Actinomycetota bacterium]